MAEGSKVAERVRNYRERLSMTIETLAEKSGVSAEVITAVEAGEVYPAGCWSNFRGRWASASEPSWTTSTRTTH